MICKCSQKKRKEKNFPPQVALGHDIQSQQEDSLTKTICKSENNVESKHLINYQIVLDITIVFLRQVWKAERSRIRTAKAFSQVD